MTREEAKSLWPIIKAFGEGEAIQIYERSVGKWYDIVECPTFTGKPDAYRVKPKIRKVTIVYKAGDPNVGVYEGEFWHDPDFKTLEVELPE